jgi:anti-anti-sigma regulatory factor
MPISADDQKTIVVHLKGEVSVRTINEIHRRITACFAKNDSITIDLEGVTESDLTLVQAIEAARQGAKKQKKRLSLSGAASGPFRELLERGGFLSRPEAADFWLGGRDPGDG